MSVKIIALFAVVAAVASAEPCGFCGGYLPSTVSGYGLNGVYGSRVLNVGCTVPVVSAIPICSPIATPSRIVDAAVAAPVVPSRIVSSGLLESGFYGNYRYGSTLDGCGTEVLASVC